VTKHRASRLHCPPGSGKLCGPVFRQMPRHVFWGISMGETSGWTPHRRSAVVFPCEVHRKYTGCPFVAMSRGHPYRGRPGAEGSRREHMGEAGDRGASDATPAPHRGAQHAPMREPRRRIPPPRPVIDGWSLVSRLSLRIGDMSGAKHLSRRCTVGPSLSLGYRTQPRLLNPLGIDVRERRPYQA